MRKIFLLPFFITFGFQSFSQNLPLSFSQHYEYLRREQIQGKINSSLSFNVRPFAIEKAFPEFSSAFLADSSIGIITKPSFIKSKNAKLRITAIPIQLLATYNSSTPNGWENSELLSNVGLQTIFSTGFHLKLGKLSVQFNPNFHYAQNKEFEEYPSKAPNEYFRRLSRSVFGIDKPVRYGTGSISNINLGNSHVGAYLGGIFLGLSSENIWAGPGQFTSLILSDNAPGFYHFRLQSTKPLKTFLGNFEGIYWAGQLKSSESTHFSDGNFQTVFGEKDESSWRYFTGLTISYSPKWIPGLSIGGTRGFQIYRDDMADNFKSFFPLFAPFQKEEEGLIESLNLRQDQNVSVFSRYLVSSAKAEIYFEFSRNDHPLNWRDLLMNIEHSRAFQLGFSKYIKLPNKYSLGFQGEITQSEFSINNIIRWPNRQGLSNSGLGAFDNVQVNHGWTHEGQLLGSNTGISGNSYLIQVGIYDGFEEISIRMERFENQPNFYEFANTAGMNVDPWIDNSFFVNYSNSFEKFLLKSSMGITTSYNNNFLIENLNQDGFSTGTDKNGNFSMNLSLIYLL
ncbi:capsule assembly Wzi family protein [Algoriphagus machipongonensis]|nr:capsule assembly Wzi family protein [Algoriphagus machipongonensis]